METLRIEKDNTAYFGCLFRDQLDQLADPTFSTYKVIDIKGNTIVSGTPIKQTTGSYFFFWSPSSTGDYLVKFEGKINNNLTTWVRKVKVVDSGVEKKSWSSSSSSSSSSTP